MLTRHANRNLFSEQPERLELLSQADRSMLTGPALAGGTMCWFDDVTDALQLMPYEESHGHIATLLYDLEFEGLWVVLSSRPHRRRKGR